MSNASTIQTISIDRLLLDENNPRFGGGFEQSGSQESVLRRIIDDHGINDLLTSMSTNGYFSAEPIVAVVAPEGKFTVVEGNRRLAAALVLTESDRASGYKRLAQRWVTSSTKEKVDSLKQIPVSVLEERNKELIAYLGAKHIRGGKPWDSYAKAHWLFELMSVSRSELTVREAARLVGDQSPNTVKRVLEGYLLMQQLRKERNYRPESSLVRGRGSNPYYPFSWVYTALGFENIRTWTGIKDLGPSDKISSDTRVLMDERSLENGEKLVCFLFGSSDKGWRQSVRESRQIAILNRVVKDDFSVKELENGESVDEVWENLRPVEDRLEDLFYRTTKNLESINTLVARETLRHDELEQFRKLGKRSQKILSTVIDTLESR